MSRYPSYSVERMDQQFAEGERNEAPSHIESAVICALIDASKKHAIKLHKHDIGVLARAVVGSIREISQSMIDAGADAMAGADTVDGPSYVFLAEHCLRAALAR